MNSNRIGQLRAVLGLIVVVAVFYGCGAATRVFTHPEADMSYYGKVGVVPFQNLSSDRFAGEKFSVEFTTALLAANKFEVVEQGIFVNAVVQVVGTRTVADGLTTDQLKKISEVTGVQGVFEGVVTQYDMSPSGGSNFPVIGAEVRLVDAETGTVVWKASVSERGGPKTPIIGVGEIHTLGELAQKLSKILVSKID